MSDQLEQELAAVLRDRAFGVGFDTEVPDDLGPRVRRARTRRNVMFGAAIAAVVLVIGGSAAVLVDRGGRGEDVRLGPPTTDDLTPSTVAGLNDGRIVELNANGTVARELLADATEDDGTLDHIEIAGDGSVWYLVVDASNCGRLRRLPAAGGEPQLVMEDVTGFGLGPNGERAVGLGLDCETGQPTSVVVVFDEAGVEQNRFDTDGEGGGRLQLAWSPDGRALAVAACFEGCQLEVVDPDRDDPWGDGHTLNDGENPTWVDGALWFNAPVRESDLEGAGIGSFVRFDPETNETTNYANVVEGEWISATAPEEGSLLLVASDPAEPPDTTLYRWDLQPGPAEPVRDGVVAVATSHLADS